MYLRGAKGCKFNYIQLVMTILIALSFILLLAYTLTVCIIAKQIPVSLSSTVFYLPQKYRIVWTLVIVIAAFCMMPSFIMHAPETYQFLAFISCAAFAFVGAAPLVKDESDISYKVHMVSAWTCAICSQLLIALTTPIILLGWIPWIIIYIITLRKGWVQKAFWAEIICFMHNYLFCLW